MSDVTISEEELRGIPQSREILSFRLALDGAGRFVCFKTALPGGRSESLLLTDAVVLHLRDRIAERLRTRQKGDRLTADREFFRRQPEPGEADWNPANAHVGVPLGAQVVTYTDLCILAFPLDREGTHTAYRMSPLHAAYLMHAINDAEENAKLGKRGRAATAASPEDPAAEGKTLH